MDEVSVFYLWWIVYNLIVFISTVFFYIRRDKIFTKKSQNIIFFILMGLSCYLLIYANITSDYYNYKFMLNELNIYRETPFIETFYSDLAFFVNYDLSNFRRFIIIPSFLLLGYIFYYYSVDKIISITFFVIFFMYSFGGVIRSSLSDAFFFAGLLFFVKNRTALSLVFFLSFFLASLFFHKSILLLLFSCVMAFIPIKTKYLKYILFSVVPVIFILRYIISLVLSSLGDVIGDNSYLSNNSHRDFTPFLLSLVLNSFYYFYLGLLLYKLKDLLNESNYLLKYLYKFLFFSFTLLLILFFQNISFYVHERFFIHNTIPFCLLFAYLLKKRMSIYRLVALLLPVFLLFQNLYIYMLLQRCGILR